MGITEKPFSLAEPVHVPPGHVIEGCGLAAMVRPLPSARLVQIRRQRSTPPPTWPPSMVTRHLSSSSSSAWGFLSSKGGENRAANPGPPVAKEQRLQWAEASL